MLLYGPMAQFSKVKVKLTYRDLQNKKNKFKYEASSEVGFSETAVHIITRKLLDFLKKEGNKNAYEASVLPLITEANLDQVKDMTKTLKIKDWWLGNMVFHLKNISFQKYRQGSKGINLVLDLIVPHAEVVLELYKVKFDAHTPAQAIKDIFKIVTTHGRVPDGRRPEYKKIRLGRDPIEPLELAKNLHAVGKTLQDLGPTGYGNALLCYKAAFAIINQPPTNASAEATLIQKAIESLESEL